MSCNCEPRKYEISMGCCQPVLGPIENYYTKYQVDKLIESATTSGCCITPEEVDEKIDEAISGITVSGVTEEELNNAIASAKTEIEAEIPTVPTKVSAFENDVPYLTEHQSLSGYATEQWVLDKHYISGIDLSDYATKDEIPTVPTKVSAFENDVPYLTEHQSLSGYATEQWVSSFTYDQATIDEKVAQGGTFDPTQYYNKTATNALLDEKLDVTAYTPTDLSNYYNKQEVNNIVESAKTEVEAEIPTVPVSNTAFTNDAGYLTEHQSLSAYSTTNEVTRSITEATSGKASQSDVNSISGAVTAHTADTTIHVTSSDKTNWDYKISAIELANVPWVTGAARLRSAKNGTSFQNFAYLSPINGKTIVSDGTNINQFSLVETSAITSAITSGSTNDEVPSAKAVYDSLDTKVDSSTYNTYTAATDAALSGKQDTLSAGTGISISGNVISATGGGGESCTVDEKVIVKPFQMTSYANLDAVYVCYSGSTYKQYYNLLINGISSWFTGYIDFSTGDHTGNTSGWENYYTVTWDSANARFLFAAKGNYKIQTIDNGNLYYQVPLYTISGTPCDAAVELADALEDTIANVDKELENKANSTALYNYVMKSQIWCGTQQQYDQISPKDPETLYLIHS